MKKYSYFTAVVAASAILGTASCDKFLETVPDNRVIVDSKDEIHALLASAYSNRTYITMGEYMSDNVEDLGDDIASNARMYDQMYNWEVITDQYDESDPKGFWSGTYHAIACANQALETIESLGGVEATGLYAEMAEALLCRAYGHFMLVNIFCQNYNSRTSFEDLGIPYVTTSETTLAPVYTRGTVAEVYKKIEDDLLLALPYVSDSYYSVPKYHFTPRAAYAFAARFFLFYEKWELAVEYATKCLGNQSSIALRDWKARSSLSATREVLSQDFIKEEKECNLLLVTAETVSGFFFGYPGNPKYTHTVYLASTETCYTKNIWGNTSIGWADAKDYFYDDPKEYSGSGYSQIALFKIPYLFEYTDPVAGIGYPHAVYPAFTTDETLLTRAEANILLGNYEDACADMNLWLHNIINTSKFNKNLTVEDIKAFYDKLSYATWNNYDSKTHEIKNNMKKELHPAFEIPKDEYAEPMLQCVLQFKRIDGLCMGLRWFDIKRYGIEIWRRTLKSDSSARPIGYSPMRCNDILKKDDLRRAVQLPLEVISAGLPENPRP